MGPNEWTLSDDSNTATSEQISQPNIRTMSNNCISLIITHLQTQEVRCTISPQFIVMLNHSRYIPTAITLLAVNTTQHTDCKLFVLTLP